MSNKHKHIIVGGGFAGLRAARLLANRNDVDVLVINPQLNFEYHGSLYRSANGYSPLETVIPYREIFKGTDVLYQQDFMVDVDPVKKHIKLLSGQELGYDSLTLALGYEPEYFGIPGMREFSKTLYSLADALELRKSLVQLAKQSFLKSAPARVIVAGGGPTGVEVAASITRFFEMITGDSRVEVSLIEAQNRILGGLSEDFAYQVERSLANQIEIQCGKKVIRATKELLHIADGPAQAFDILIWTAGSSANSYFRQRSDIFEVDHKGRVLVNKYLQTNHDGLYVVGDSAAVMYSGTAHAAIEMGAYIASHLIAKLQSQNCAGFLPSQPEYAVPTGHETAVAMQGTKLVGGQEGWQLRREFDLRALSLIASKEVAHAHWLRGEDFATIFSAANL
ncbi:FAD-dependent oxidoreductase [Candidatus Saccharibacteria bacterium]|nr:FAD-dependent oxidoreductase [Candidatus Saccharibacteria bacterium]